MHRRHFISAAIGALLFPAGRVHGRQDATVAPEATAVPAHHGRQRPIVLGDGIELVDYRVYPSDDVPRIIGEISSTRDEMIDAPVVSVVFGDLGASGLAYAPPVLPVMRPGQSNMIFGVLPEEIDTDEKLQQAEFGLCAPVVSAKWTERFSDVEFEIVISDEQYWHRSLNISGHVTNHGSKRIEYTAIQGLIRDSDYRLAGAISRGRLDHFSPGQSKEFFVWASAGTPTLADAYRLLDTEEPYRVELHMSLIDFLVPAGCDLFRP
jgi:hypothetical protein